jgi:hypothetical protein
MDEKIAEHAADEPEKLDEQILLDFEPQIQIQLEANKASELPFPETKKAKPIFVAVAEMPKDQPAILEVRPIEKSPEVFPRIKRADVFNLSKSDFNLKIDFQTASVPFFIREIAKPKVEVVPPKTAETPTQNPQKEEKNMTENVNEVITKPKIEDQATNSEASKKVVKKEVTAQKAEDVKKEPAKIVAKKRRIITKRPVPILKSSAARDQTYLTSELNIKLKPKKNENKKSETKKIKKFKKIALDNLNPSVKNKDRSSVKKNKLEIGKKMDLKNNRLKDSKNNFGKSTLEKKSKRIVKSKEDVSNSTLELLAKKKTDSKKSSEQRKKYRKIETRKKQQDVNKRVEFKRYESKKTKTEREEVQNEQKKKFKMAEKRNEVVLKISEPQTARKIEASEIPPIARLSEFKKALAKIEKTWGSKNDSSEKSAILVSKNMFNSITRTTYRFENDPKEDIQNKRLIKIMDSKREILINLAALKKIANLPELREFSFSTYSKEDQVSVKELKRRNAQNHNNLNNWFVFQLIILMTEIYKSSPTKIPVDLELHPNIIIPI